MIVSVFGSSRIERDGAEYREAYLVGRLLAKRGYVVCNGGYSGAMEAVSRGCKEAGGRTIGVTVRVFDGLTPNEFIDEEVGTASLLLRLDKLTELGDAYVVLLGGIGTLLETSLVWNLKLMHVYPRKPIVLLGTAWRETIDSLARYLLIREVDRAAFLFADTPHEAIAALERHAAKAAEQDSRG